MNKYLEKIAKSTTGLTDSDKNMIGAGAGVVGAGLIHKQIARGNITGRETLYHGSTKSRVDSIKEHGLKPAQGGGISELTSDHLENMNKPYVFAAKHKFDAGTYSVQQEGIQSGKFKTLMDRNLHLGDIQVGGLKKVIHDKGSIAKINLPTWKNELRNNRNPELKPAFKSIGDQIFLAPSTKKLQKKIAYDTLQNRVHTNKGAIGPEYIKGSSKYQANSLKEVGEFIRANPGRFAKGVGKVGLGAGLIAGGASLFHSTNKK